MNFEPFREWHAATPTNEVNALLFPFRENHYMPIEWNIGGQFRYEFLCSVSRLPCRASMQVIDNEKIKITRLVTRQS